jgi:hypothetical protein
MSDDGSLSKNVWVQGCLVVLLGPPILSITFMILRIIFKFSENFNIYIASAIILFALAIPISIVMFIFWMWGWWNPGSGSTSSDGSTSGDGCNYDPRPRSRIDNYDAQGNYTGYSVERKEND